MIMTKLTTPQLRGLRSYLTLGGEKPSAKIALELVTKGLLESRAFGHVLTNKGEHTAYTLTNEEEQELMGLLTHDRVIFQRSETNTRFFRIHTTLKNLGLSTSAHLDVNEPGAPNGVSFTFRCPL